MDLSKYSRIEADFIPVCSGSGDAGAGFGVGVMTDPTQLWKTDCHAHFNITYSKFLQQQPMETVSQDINDITEGYIGMYFSTYALSYTKIRVTAIRLIP